MKPKFTPGPWKMLPDSWHGDHAEISSSEWGALALVVNKIDGQVSENGSSNAHLIAAAPDMYAKLDEISDGLLEAGGYGNCRLAKEIESLLAKARGEV